MKNKKKNHKKNIIGKILAFNKRIGAAIVLMLLALLGLIFSFGRGSSQIEEAAEQAPKLATEIRTKFQTRNDYWGLDTETALRMQAVPQEMIKSEKIVNALGRDVLIGNGPEGQKLMPGAKNFSIVYKNLNPKECIGIASHKFGEKSLLGLIHLTIFNGNTENTYSWGSENQLPITRAEAQKICGKENILIFGYE